jgi:AraC-like DNA-binding protein
LRLEEAKQMLETSDHPIEAIANEIGYEDAGFFSRLFRRGVNLTPAQYLEIARAQRSVAAIRTGPERPLAGNFRGDTDRRELADRSPMQS